MTELASLDLDERDGFVVARVTGEVDVSVSSQLGDQVLDAVPTSARGVVMDLAELDFIDSSGIAMLFGLVRSLSARRQGLMVVAPADRAVARVLEIVEFERAAPVHRELEPAIAALDSAG